ncbi:hypothetical protein GDO81_000965 [Engystomops pustulosus]|uniref:Uncharacterized protein n=1 Tax=Engystomops pustulosus TaxID=76066 RepID=A0AAV7DCA0_ENGPU|nr:hypothetical protein GDO81_000965 [Engystomops pustulosus]
MPISSGAEGHVGVGVDRSIKWVPEGGEDYQAVRISNSYLQRYLNLHGGQEKIKEVVIENPKGLQSMNNSHNRINANKDLETYLTEQKRQEHGTVQGHTVKKTNVTMYTLQNSRKTAKEDALLDSNNINTSSSNQQQNKALVSTNGPVKKSRVCVIV